MILIVAMTIITGAATYAITAREAKRYASQATLLYSASSSSEDPTRAVDTIVGVSSSSAVLGPVAKSSGMTLGWLQGSLAVKGDPNADLITISASSDSPVLAAKIANDVASALISFSAAGQKSAYRAQIASLQRQLAVVARRTDPSSLAAASNLRTQLAQASGELAVAAPPLAVLSRGRTPTGAVSPHPKRDAVIGLLAGLVLGVMLGVLRDRLDSRIRGIEEVEAIYQAPILGVVPFTKGRRGMNRAASLANFAGSGALADAYRTIRTNLTLGLNGADRAVVVVTSATAGEGKSTVAANLAHALSVTGRQVLVVSADLHNPTLHEYFSSARIQSHEKTLTAGRELSGSSRASRFAAPEKPAGLVQVLAGEVDLSAAVRTIPLSEPEQERGGSLHLLANRSTFFDPAVLLSSSSMQDFIEDASKEYDVIVLDTPPVLANADATLLAQEANVLVIVARLDQLTKNQARRAVQVMAAARLVATGIIVTGDVGEPIYEYYHGYGADSATNGSGGRAQSSA